MEFSFEFYASELMKLYRNAIGDAFVLLNDDWSELDSLLDCNNIDTLDDE